MQLHVNNETAMLKAVVLGQPGLKLPTPAIEAVYDAVSYDSVLKGIYPTAESVSKEMNAFEKVLLKYNVQIFRPSTLESCNQIFARDVGFVIEDKIINSNIIPEREVEKEAYGVIYDQIPCNKIFNLPGKAHIEGGDVVLYNDIVFVGVYTAEDYPLLKTARTNAYAVNFLEEIFPAKTFIPLELKKHNTDPTRNILHLDCTFTPVGHDKAIIYRDGFIHERDFYTLVDIFGIENIFELTNDEMVRLNANVFSISPGVVVSEQRSDRLNRQLEDWGFTVERVPYHEISKMGGSLRCSTLPLTRNDASTNSNKTLVKSE
ncbi:MAG TPA: arginine deiminase family protein [Paludibacter sp.]|nr:arginine deiminase family protein [Paludibacter sp.]